MRYIEILIGSVEEVLDLLVKLTGNILFFHSYDVNELHTLVKLQTYLLDKTFIARSLFHPFIFFLAMVIFDDFELILIGLLKTLKLLMEFLSFILVKRRWTASS